MNVTYNPDEDKLRILFCSAPIQESETHRAGLILDFDQNGRIVGLELSDASAHMSTPCTVNFAERTFALAAGGSQTEEE